MRTLASMRFARRLWAPATALVMMLVGCEDDGTVKPSGKVDQALVFTREDGSAVMFPAGSRAFVWCGPWEQDLVPVPSLHIWFGNPENPEEPRGWSLDAVVGDIGIGDTLRFPNYFIWDQPDSVRLSLMDPPNELTTATEESGGFIVFHRLPCPSGTTVDFSIDAVIGSELSGMPRVTVRGRFIARVTAPLSAGRN